MAKRLPLSEEISTELAFKDEKLKGKRAPGWTHILDQTHAGMQCQQFAILSPLRPLRRRGCICHQTKGIGTKSLPATNPD
jgi:hypothetical protein